MTERRSILPTTHQACLACGVLTSDLSLDSTSVVCSWCLDRSVSQLTLSWCTVTNVPTHRSRGSMASTEGVSMTLTSSTGTRIHLSSSQPHWVQETLSGLGGL